MKKILIGLVVFAILCGSAFCQDAVYRISSGEVTAIGNDIQPHNSFFALKTGATFPDGVVCRNAKQALRVPGIAKILDGDVIRNATQEEIDTFVSAAIEDRNIKEASEALNYFQTDPRLRRIMIALVSILVDRFNADHQWAMDLKQVIADSTSLADFQSRVAAMGNLPTDLDISDVRDAIKNRISKDD